MATLTVQETTIAGITPTWASAAETGDEFLNTGDCYCEVKNGSGAEITVTVATPGKIEGFEIENSTVAVAATTGVKRFGPFDPSICNNSSGRVAVTYSAHTTVTVGAFKL